MSVSKLDVQPGWRGTDPDGGTWVLTNAGDAQPWMQMSTGGVWDWRSQEEAEAAGLVRLIPAVGYHYDEHGEDVVPDVEVDDAPAPLDPRQVATAEELDALPDSAVVVDADGGSWQRNGHINCVPMWDRSGESERWTSGEISLPAVVVWMPGAAAPAPIPLGASAVTDAERAGEAETFLAHWAGGNRVSAKDREDFIAAWTGWHRGADFDRECAERDAKAAIDAYVSALAVERAELTAALADARSAAPAPLDPGNPEHLRQAASLIRRTFERFDPSVEETDVEADLLRWADRLDRERAAAAQDAADRKRAEEIAMVAWADGDGYAQWHNAPEQHRADLIAATLAGIRAGRAERQEAGQ